MSEATATSRQIWKFPVPESDTPVIQMPEGARLLSAAFQGPHLMVWAEVDTTAQRVGRAISVYGTGHEMTGRDDVPFVGTVFTGTFVFHVFDEGEVPLHD